MLIEFKVEGFKNFEKELVFDLSKIKNENLLDLSMLNEQDAKSIQNIYESLIQLKK